MDPAVGTAQVKDLPGLQLNGGCLTGASNLRTLQEPANDPVSPGGVEDEGKLRGSLPFQVFQMPLAGGNLVGTAPVMEFALDNLLAN